jgi:hypothetical protein
MVRARRRRPIDDANNMAARVGEKLRVRAGGLGRPSKPEKDWFFFDAHTPSCLFSPSVISLYLPSLSGNE